MWTLPPHPRSINSPDRSDIEPEDDWVPRYKRRSDSGHPGHRASVPMNPIVSVLRCGGADSVLGEGRQRRLKMINARAETVATKPAFREALKKRRCLIAADGFLRVAKERQDPKTPFCFTMADDSIFAFAGIWEPVGRIQRGNLVETCSIITTTPKRSLRRTFTTGCPSSCRRCIRPVARPRLPETEAVSDLLKPFNRR